mgnify:CR=1 FL=1
MAVGNPSLVAINITMITAPSEDSIKVQLQQSFGYFVVPKANLVEDTVNREVWVRLD